MRYALGTDGGGSKTEAVLIDETGQVLAWQRSGPSHALYVTEERARQHYAEAVREVLGTHDPASVWLGFDRDPQAMRDLFASLGPVGGVAPVNEFSAALASVQQTWGMVVHAGTGSFIAAFTPDDRHAHRGGMGPILGDFGSGYDVGHRGLQAAFLDRYPGHETTLAEAIPEYLDVENLNDTFSIVYRGEWGRREMASLAAVVDQQAEAGDAPARQCLLQAADSLADFALEIIDEFGWTQTAFPMIASGSVAQNSRLWWEHFCARILAVAPQAQPLRPQVRPVVGAALLAFKEMGVAWTDELVQHIISTQQPWLASLGYKVSAVL